MSSFPRSPRLRKGAIVSLDALSLVPQTIVFQYNPDSLSRTLNPKTTQNKAGGAETFRLEGPPEEQIDLEIELDAADQLENPAQNPSTVLMGINPQLAALETIMYPKSSQVIANTELAALGTMEIVPPEGPFTVFVWGPNRVLPVRLVTLKVSEEAYDTELNPIRAKVTLSLKVLSYADLQKSHVGYSLYMANHTGKETMAAAAGAGAGITGIGSLV